VAVAECVVDVGDGQRCTNFLRLKVLPAASLRSVDARNLGIDDGHLYRAREGERAGNSGPFTFDAISKPRKGSWRFV
jgi:hypothetical protein